MRSAILLLLAFLLLVSSPGFADGYISSPARVPLFGDFTTPVVEPGHSGRLNFTITNRYEEPIYNVVVTLEIYAYATLDEYREIAEVDPRPLFEGEGVFVSATYDMIGAGGVVPFETTVVAPGGAPDGVYFVRASLEFTHNGTRYYMCSPGFFPRDVWDEATANYSLNLSLLSEYLGREVSGIVPDTSFSVKSPPNLVPLAAIIGIAVFLAVYWVYKELKGVEVTRLDEEYYRLKGKYRELEKELERRLRKKGR